MITYKFPLSPSKEQCSKLWKHANLLNKLYNYFLSQRIDLYNSEGLNISRYQQQKNKLKKYFPKIEED